MGKGVRKVGRTVIFQGPVTVMGLSLTRRRLETVNRAQNGQLGSSRSTQQLWESQQTCGGKDGDCPHLIDGEQRLDVSDVSMAPQLVSGRNRVCP